jgi:ADP-ribose pyrophosphatase YjhB (NUDIX family)
MGSIITFDQDGKRFNYRIAGVALHRNRVLLNREEEHRFWFMPGGRAEMLEPAHETLQREFREELNVEIQVGGLLWFVESFFERFHRAYHQLSLYFLVTLPDDWPLLTIEEPFRGSEEQTNLLFQWYHLDELAKLHMYPVFLKQALQALPETTEHILDY